MNQKSLNEQLGAGNHRNAGMLENWARQESSKQDAIHFQPTQKYLPGALSDSAARLLNTRFAGRTIVYPDYKCWTREEIGARNELYAVGYLRPAAYGGIAIAGWVS